MNATNARVGILAYGSLIKDPGVEIEPLIVERIQCLTPFPVEYARFSSSRGGGPTVVPHTSGNPVRAEILVLRPSTALVDAKNKLWRRETRQEGSSKCYVAGNSPNSVLVVDCPGFQGVAHVLYTDFLPSGKISNPEPSLLASAAVASVAKAPVGKDGISYLIQLSESGIETELSAQYCTEVLRLTSAGSLEQARNNLKAAEPESQTRRTKL